MDLTHQTEALGSLFDEVEPPVKKRRSSSPPSSLHKSSRRATDTADSRPSKRRQPPLPVLRDDRAAEAASNVLGEAVSRPIKRRRSTSPELYPIQAAGVEDQASDEARPRDAKRRRISSPVLHPKVEVVLRRREDTRAAGQRPRRKQSITRSCMFCGDEQSDLLLDIAGDMQQPTMQQPTDATGDHANSLRAPPPLSNGTEAGCDCSSCDPTHPPSIASAQLPLESVLQSVELWNQDVSCVSSTVREGSSEDLNALAVPDADATARPLHKDAAGWRSWLPQWTYSKPNQRLFSAMDWAAWHSRTSLSSPPKHEEEHSFACDIARLIKDGYTFHYGL